jgi:hypothetical protein
MDRKEYLKKYMRQYRRLRRRISDDGKWQCEKCEEWLAPEEFPLRGRGRSYVCRECLGRKVEVEEYEEKQELEAFLVEGKEKKLD